MVPYIAIGADKQQSHLYSTNIDYALQQLQLDELEARAAAALANGQAKTKKRKALTQITGNAQEDGGERIILFKWALIFEIEGINGADVLEDLLIVHNGYIELPISIQLTKHDNDIIYVNIMDSQCELDLLLISCVSEELLEILPEIKAAERVAGAKRRFKTGVNSAKDFGMELVLKLGANIGKPFCAELHLEIDTKMQDGWSPYSLTVARYWDQMIGTAFPNGKPVPVEKKHRFSSAVQRVKASDFYNAVTFPTVQPVPLAIQPTEMTCQLLPFQCRSVRWMLQREGFDVCDGHDSVVPFEDDQYGLPPMYHKNKNIEGKVCYVSHLLGVISTNLDGFRAEFASYKGGILAEEMGLGKTVELIALVSLNKCREVGEQPVFDSYTETSVMPSSSTLIVSPSTILHQWQKEIATHAPNLKVYHYIGLPKSKKEDIPTIQKLLEYDIVLTTYDVLSKEVHFATPPPDRILRRRKGRQNQPMRSPLIGILWWRVCMDEAQMVESGVSNAAYVARLIPRVNAWCVTGTPVGKQITDLLGLLIFLRYEPFCSDKSSWIKLLEHYPEAFKDLFARISLRHTKSDVRDEIYLPPQKRFVITVPFSHVEEENYKFFFEQMIQECEITPEGCAALDLAQDPGKRNTIINKMRFWLIRLRQICSHAQVGKKKGKGKDIELRTVDEVLEEMIEQHLSQLRSDERALFSAILRRGQVLEHYEQLEEALEAYLDVNRQLQAVVLEARQRVKEEEEEGEEEGEQGVVEKPTPPPDGPNGNHNISSNGTENPNDKGKGKATEEGEAGNYDDENEQEEQEEEEYWYDDWAKPRHARKSLRDILEIEHASLFFLGSIYYQLRTREENAKTRKAVEYAAKETDNYDAAKQIRKEILTQIEKRAQGFIEQCKRKAQTQSFTEIPEMVFQRLKGGIETETICQELQILQEGLNTQANYIDEWREMLIQLLISPLVDQDDNATGEEFEQSVNKQSEGFAYMEALKTVVADRQFVLAGQNNILAEEDLQRSLARDEPHTALLRNLILQRESFKPQINRPMRAILTRLRSIISTSKVEIEAGNQRAQFEKTFAENIFRKAEKLYNTQIKVNSKLEREMNLYRNTINARVSFYSQLQSLSDTVTPFDPEREKDVTLVSTVAWKLNEEVLAAKVADARAKERYLTHLKTSNEEEEGRVCIICQSSFDKGTFTVCGHQYCVECMAAWYKQHRSCPMCKKRLKYVDIYHISYNNTQTFKVQEENSAAHSTNSAVAVHKASNAVHAIYSDMQDNMQIAIKQRKLTNSFGSKIDMICKHILWLNESEPESKSVIFSQWSDVLLVFEQAFNANGINYAKTDKNGVTKFKTNPEVKCILLHAKSQSAGLTLVNATNVFLCEPLLNTGLELQAISRVHRIGQTKPTTVWLYVISGTVEQSVLNLSTKRRLAQAGVESDNMADMAAISETKLDKVNSEEMKKDGLVEKGAGGGEIVVDDDLLECLVGSAKDKLSSKAAGDEVRRHLMAQAAEKRIEIANGHGSGNGQGQPVVVGRAAPARGPGPGHGEASGGS